MVSSGYDEENVISDELARVFALRAELSELPPFFFAFCFLSAVAADDFSSESEADLPESVAAREEGDLEWTFEDDTANENFSEDGWEEDGLKEETGSEEPSEDEDYDEASEEIAEVYAGESCEEESDYVK